MTKIQESMAESIRHTVVIGQDLRDRALEQVLANAETDWVTKAKTVVQHLAASGREFTPDDIWTAGLERPREARALGPVMMWAVRTKVIEPTGAWRNSTQKSQHATPVRVWRGVSGHLLKQLRDGHL